MKRDPALSALSYRRAKQMKIEQRWRSR